MTTPQPVDILQLNIGSFRSLHAIVGEKENERENNLATSEFSLLVDANRMENEVDPINNFEPPNTIYYDTH